MPDVFSTPGDFFFKFIYCKTTSKCAVLSMKDLLDQITDRKYFLKERVSLMARDRKQPMRQVKHFNRSHQRHAWFGGRPPKRLGVRVVRPAPLDFEEINNINKKIKNIMRIIQAEQRRLSSNLPGEDPAEAASCFKWPGDRVRTRGTLLGGPCAWTSMIRLWRVLLFNLS